MYSRQKESQDTSAGWRGSALTF